MYSTTAIVAVALVLLITVSALLPHFLEGYATSNPVLNSNGNSVLSFGGGGSGGSTDESSLTVGGTSSGNNVVIEGGRTSDGQHVGFSAINFNGRYEGGEQRTNAAKSRWRIGVNQRGDTDSMFVDQYKKDGSFWGPLVMDAGSVFVKGAVKVGHDMRGDWTDGTPLTVVKQQTGASFRGGQYWSHFPWSDENVYIRPGVVGAHIKIGDIGDPTSIQIKDSWFPKEDGHTYIRAGGKDKSIVIGDTKAANIVLAAPVAMTGDVKVQGAAAVNRLCVGNKCLNEAQLGVIMQKAGV